MGRQSATKAKMLVTTYSFDPWTRSEISSSPCPITSGVILGE
jgi:hypothetical protein